MASLRVLITVRRRTHVHAVAYFDNAISISPKHGRHSAALLAKQVECIQKRKYWNEFENNAEINYRNVIEL